MKLNFRWFFLLFFLTTKLFAPNVCGNFLGSLIKQKDVGLREFDEVSPLYLTKVLREENQFAEISLEQLQRQCLKLQEFLVDLVNSTRNIAVIKIQNNTLYQFGVNYKTQNAVLYKNFLDDCLRAVCSFRDKKLCHDFVISQTKKFFNALIIFALYSYFYASSCWFECNIATLNRVAKSPQVDSLKKNMEDSFSLTKECLQKLSCFVGDRLSLWRGGTNTIISLKKWVAAEPINAFWRFLPNDLNKKDAHHEIIFDLETLGSFFLSAKTLSFEEIVVTVFKSLSKDKIITNPLLKQILNAKQKSTYSSLMSRFVVDRLDLAPEMVCKKNPLESYDPEKTKIELTAELSTANNKTLFNPEDYSELLVQEEIVDKKISDRKKELIFLKKDGSSVKKEILELEKKVQELEKLVNLENEVFALQNELCQFIPTIKNGEIDLAFLLEKAAQDIESLKQYHLKLDAFDAPLETNQTWADYQEKAENESCIGALPEQPTLFRFD